MILTTTNLNLLYLDGHLRYIKHGEEEIIRMVYTALRNDHWFTLPMQISKETVIQNESSFSIQYHAQYAQGDIDYEADIEIQGAADDTLSFHFKGKAKTDFLRNRIGVCVLHPIHNSLGQAVIVTQPDGDEVAAIFPTLIEPNIAFENIVQFAWKTRGGVGASLEFEGDVFESEDQRNWSDNSFKTYSTPVSIPFPVLVKSGDEVEQKVTLSFWQDVVVRSAKLPDEDKKEILVPFPRIGYASNDRPLTDAHVEMLKQIKFDHYRVEIDFAEGWLNTFRKACAEAEVLDVGIELVVLFGDYVPEYNLLRDSFSSRLGSMTILQKHASTPTQGLLDYLIPRLKSDFPSIRIGSGTNGHFVAINRTRTIDSRLDFISYGVTPLAHLSDDLTLKENLEAQQYPLKTLRSFTDLPMHISPVTLRSRDYPALTIDPRQHTPMMADWTTMSLKYLAGADQITFFEIIGPKGIINESGPSPIYDVLKRITDFQPKYIIPTQVMHPLMEDILVLENVAGERMELKVVF